MPACSSASAAGSGAGRREATAQPGWELVYRKPSGEPFQSLEVEELAELLRQGRRLTLLDVRTPAEHSICRLEGSELIPIQVLGHRWEELDPQEEIVVYCHTGGRSLRAARFLRTMGFLRAKNLKGGIDAWAEKYDPDMPRY